MPKKAHTKQNPYLSVVIATLGGPELEGTIFSLNSSTIVPAEILVVLPVGKTESLTFPIATNVRILVADSRGQVSQRCFGFRHVNYDLVLQIDDDITLEENCIEQLIDTLLNFEFPASISPMFFLRKEHKFAYRIPNRRDKFLAFIANGFLGYSPGKISRAGINFGYSETSSQYPLEVEWLPGGCVLHKKENLILTPFYPFNGKAFAEDLLHSMLLRKADVKLFLYPSAKIYFDWFDEEKVSIWQELRTFLMSSRALMYYAEKDNRNRLLLVLYLLFSFATSPLKRLIK